MAFRPSGTLVILHGGHHFDLLEDAYVQQRAALLAAGDDVVQLAMPLYSENVETSVSMVGGRFTTALAPVARTAIPSNALTAVIMRTFFTATSPVDE